MKIEITEEGRMEIGKVKIMLMESLWLCLGMVVFANVFPISIGSAFVVGVVWGALLHRWGTL